ncbi:pantetheine-phosphate adenylyltransferase [Treponema sp.]|uniref:pantetheine-phosphate adenylyltransferase n=1 Tax=Treponema sp. TaxID=166 RepID=UPI00298E915B|nr:pantetheine-phosphate adenylyltransferase [Treponema sp.]MCQ2240643.1 pantetheine-phosphate adenylyltransferase [Treponema sp.]
MIKAVFAGTFDPPTLGHLNIIERSSKLFDQLDVLVSVNPDKHTLFSDKERMDMLLELTKGFSNVSVHIWNSLVVDYCKKENATVLVRGVRNAMDFAHEFDLSLMNRQLGSDIETLFLPTEQKYFLVRSSSIKEAARFGGDISKMVPPLVEKALKTKFS